MADEQAGGNNVQTTTINRSWMVKMVIFTTVLIGFGLWGLYDATIAYPTRGRVHAEYAKYRYLEAAKTAGKIGATAEEGEPRSRLATLEAKSPRSDLEQAEFDWLTALSRVGQLNAEQTRIESPNRELDELSIKWKSQQQPLPLEGYALALQWAMTAAGFGAGLYVIMNIARSMSKKYTWDAATSTLTLPGGKAVTPEMLADVDKRRWHKYFCSLVFNDGAEPVELDLLKYQGLEEWVLTLENVRFPERAAEAAAAAAEAAAATDDEPSESEPIEGEGPGNEQGKA